MRVFVERSVLVVGLRCDRLDIEEMQLLPPPPPWQQQFLL